MKFLLFMCALAQLVTAQNGSTGTLTGTKKQDFKLASFFNSGGSVVIGGGKKQEDSRSVAFSIDSGNPIIIGGNGKKSDFSSDTGGNGTAVGSTQDPLGKKKDLALQGEPITNPTRKKQDFSFSDSGGNGTVIGTGGIKKDLCESGGTGVSAGSSTGNLGKKNDFRHS